MEKKKKEEEKEKEKEKEKFPLGEHRSSAPLGPLPKRTYSLKVFIWGYLLHIHQSMLESSSRRPGSRVEILARKLRLDRYS